MDRIGYHRNHLGRKHHRAGGSGLCSPGTLAGASGSTGRSLNYYNQTTETWHQTWVDNAGNPLILSGKVWKGKMVMRTDEQTGPNGTAYYNRITWSPQEDGSVMQQWDIMSPSDSLLSTVFLGVYRKKEE
jgi:hypothetical protein